MTFKVMVSDDTLKEQKEKYSRPENCTFLTVPKVNEEIWQHAHDTIKSKDIKFQNIQKVLMKGLTVVVELMNKTMVAIENQSAVSRSDLRLMQSPFCLLQIGRLI